MDFLLAILIVILVDIVLIVIPLLLWVSFDEDENNGNVGNHPAEGPKEVT